MSRQNPCFHAKLCYNRSNLDMEGDLMKNLTVACIQPRMAVFETREAFEAEARRFLRQAQAKAAQLAIFPELVGLMLAPPLISGVKKGLIKRVAQARHSEASFMAQRVGSVSKAAAGALGGGFRGSLARLLRKNGDQLEAVYLETFGALAREFEMCIAGGSLYLYDPESETVRHRAYLFNAEGEVLGFQDKLNLSVDEVDLASPGNDLAAIETPFGRVGLLLGQDAMYPELARGLAIQGADLLIGLVANPGVASAAVIRSALALRAEENQVFVAASFLLGPNLLGQGSQNTYFGRSALLAPISLTPKGDGIVMQAGTDRTESFFAAELDGEALESMRQTSRFQPRREMHLGNLGPVLAEMYRDGLTVDEAIAQRLAAPPEPVAEPPAPEPFAKVAPAEPEAEVPSPGEETKSEEWV
jgi:predicted amidohydrolase